MFKRGHGASHILNDEMGTTYNSTGMKRNLKTAGGVGYTNLENELFSKDIAYKANFDKTPAIFTKNTQ